MRESPISCLLVEARMTGKTLLQVSLDNQLDVEGACGGPSAALNRTSRALEQKGGKQSYERASLVIHGSVKNIHGSVKNTQIIQ